jgi:hypothetical protein
MEQTEVIDSRSHQRIAARVAKEEAELAELIKQASGETDEAEQEVEQDAAPEVEAKPLDREEETFKKRYGDIRKHLADKEREWETKLEQMKSQLDLASRNELVLPKSDSDIEAWAKKYPDVAGIVEAIADRKAAERSGDLDNRLKEIEKLRTQATKEKAEVELMKFHPDFSDIREDNAFHDWAEEQPKWVQDALYENTDDARSVARVIDLYKQDKGIAKLKVKSDDKAAASSVSTRRGATAEPDQSSNYLTESAVNKMSSKEYDKRQEEILEAMRTGKFIYDMSRK